MTVRHFCTYFDHNYLPRGMVMLESLREHCPHAHVHVLCLSEQCYAALTKLAYPHVSLVRLVDLEAADPELAATRSTRSLVEYYFTITPCLPWYLLTRGNPLDQVTYLDADMMFFSSPEPIFVEAADASVIITPHRFSKHLSDLVKYGIYNVSWITFCRTMEGMKCLSWYRKSCLSWCKDKVEENRFADQKYLDDFPRLFSKVHVICHKGAGVAPWNLSDAHISSINSAPAIDGEKLIFYHAHGFKHICGPLYSSGLLGYDSLGNVSAIENIVEPYTKKYSSAVHTTKKVIDLSSFVGVRQEQKRMRTFLRTCKNTLREWRRKSLVILWS